MSTDQFMGEVGSAFIGESAIMRTRKFELGRAAAVLAVAAAALAVGGEARAAEYWLKATAFVMPDPNGDPTGIPMWGYAECTSDFASCLDPVSPGPALRVPSGENTLRIHLRNALPAPPNGSAPRTSLVINGLVKPLTPVWDNGQSGARPSAAARVRSFDAEAEPNGNDAIYNWLNVSPGTYLYQSGTQPQVQVQMGLYGALTRNFADAAATRPQAYNGLPYDNQATLLYSEIDPDLHTAVKDGTYGAGGTVTSTLGYAPRFFLVNGRPYQIGAPLIVPQGNAGTTLLRLLNAGLRTHVPMIQGNHWDLVAEDGKAYPYPRKQYTALLSAAKTMDVLLTRSAGATHAIIDRRLSLSNNGLPDGGMLAFLGTGAVAAAGGAGDPGVDANLAPIAAPDAYVSVPGATLSVESTGVLGNDNPTDGPVLKAVAMSGATTRGGTYSLNANGSFTYVPPPPASATLFTGTDTFDYQATDGAKASNSATVTIDVATPAAPTFPGTLDAFDRAAATSLGADWAQIAATGSPPDLQIQATAGIGSAKAATASLGGQAIWIKNPGAGVFGPRQGASFTLGAIAENSALILKATGGTTPASPANFIRVRYEASGEIVVSTLVGGSNTAVYVRHAGFPALGSTGTLSAAVDERGLVTVFQNGAYIGGVQLPDVSVWKGNGRIGIQLQTEGASIDDFAGASL